MAKTPALFVTKNNRRLTMDCSVTHASGARGKVIMFCCVTKEVLVACRDGSEQWLRPCDLTTEHGVAA